MLKKKKNLNARGKALTKERVVGADTEHLAETDTILTLPLPKKINNNNIVIANMKWIAYAKRVANLFSLLYNVCMPIEYTHKYGQQCTSAI
jgi:hypothetical protein